MQCSVFVRCGTTWYPLLPYDLDLFDTFDKYGIMGFENNLLNFNVFKFLFALTSCHTFYSFCPSPPSTVRM